MKKVFSLMLITMLLLTGCSDKESNKETQVEEKQPESATNIEKFDISGNYKLAYKKIVLNAEEESKSPEWDSITYMLIDIDNNTVPELLLYYQGCSACTKIDYYTLDGNDAISIGSTDRHTIIYEKDKKYYTGKTAQGYDVISELSINNKKIIENSVVEGQQLTSEYSKVEEFESSLSRIEFKKLADFEYKNEVDENIKDNSQIVGTYFAIDEDATNTEWWLFNEDNTWERQASLCEGYARYKGTYTIENYKNNEVIKASFEKYTIYLKIIDDKITYMESDLPENTGNSADGYPYTYLQMGGCNYLGANDWQKNSKLKIKYETPGWAEDTF